MPPASANILISSRFVEHSITVSLAMKTRKSFTIGEDLYEFFNEIYGSEQQPVAIVLFDYETANGNSRRIILLLPFTPVSRNNLIAWIAGDRTVAITENCCCICSPNKDYGPEQIEAFN